MEWLNKLIIQCIQPKAKLSRGQKQTWMEDYQKNLEMTGLMSLKEEYNINVNKSSI